MEEIKEQLAQDLNLPLKQITPKRAIILQYLSTVPSAKMDDMLEHCPNLRTTYNSKNYLSETLSKMIKLQMIQRVSRGTYALRTPSVQTQAQPQSQSKPPKITLKTP